MDWKMSTEALLRWAHVVAGVIWIGHLYFFNFVNGPFAGTMDKDTKQKVVPELMPRALFWFRWGAAWTWITGVLLMMLVYWHSTNMFDDPHTKWSPASFAVVAVILVGPFLYDALAKSIKSNQMLAVVGIVLVAAVLWVSSHHAGLGYRSGLIHVGAIFGTLMAFNVWYRIWPNQRQIIAAIKSGQAPDAALVALAGARSKHNTYMSVPLIWTMLGQHTTALNVGYPGASTVLVVIVGWLAVQLLYKKSAAVKGF